MNELIFEWDSRKAKSNQKKHGVSFEEAKTVFFDEQAICYYDPDHAQGEERYIMLGTSYWLNEIVVCHCFRENETILRIISARKANKDETNAYWENRK